MIDFGHRRDRALAATPAGALFNADGRGDTGDQIHIWPRQLLHKLSRVRIHGIQKTPLPLRKQKIKRECAFARTAYPRNHNELVPRNFQRNIL